MRQPEKSVGRRVGDLEADIGNAVGGAHPDARGEIGAHLKSIIRGGRGPDHDWQIADQADSQGGHSGIGGDERDINFAIAESNAGDLHAGLNG